MVTEFIAVSGAHRFTLSMHFAAVMCRRGVQRPTEAEKKGQIYVEATSITEALKGK